ncbi:winged helix DNA-binding domain-containing protein [Actinoplanes sp. NPDC051851]|uniref:winged helix DNA-binding domain-containing protein n=1 Tax=Actinoplanes sp. NPDC051851 TaxID=3154753 RepID=UPI0034490970
MPPLTVRALNRATLARQMLLAREAVPVVEAVRRLVGLQAQAPASPFLSLWCRVAHFDAAALRGSFFDRTVVRGTLMRITLHAALAGDYPDLHAAVLRILRAARLGDRRFTAAGLSIEEADAFLPVLLEFTAVPRTGPEIEAMIASHFGGERKGLWWALRTYAPVLRAPDDSPWCFGPASSFQSGLPASSFHSGLPASSLHSGLPASGTDRDSATRALVRRYLAAYGPATIADIARFTLLPRAVLRAAVAADLRSADVIELSAGLYDVPGAPLPDEDTPAPPRLLPMWDNVLLAHADQARFTTPEHRKAFARVNGDVLPTLLVDGRVAGVWRATPEGIEATAFHPLSRADWAGLSAEAAALTAFLAPIDPLPFARHAHWFTKPLPAAEIRLLPR